MKRTDADLNVANQFADGDPTIPTAGTMLDASWLNNVQEELCNAVEADGTTLDGSVHTQLRALLEAMLAATTPGGRLTLATATPVNTGSLTSVGTVYYTPYKHTRIALYNGTRWVLKTFAELSQTLADSTKSPAAGVADTMYDYFVWDDSGTLRCTRGPAWSSHTARGTGAGTTELELFQGRYVNKVAVTNGPAARCGLYVGSILTIVGSAVVHDHDGHRYLWNNYNRVSRSMKVTDVSGNWNYTTATLRQANGSTANQLDFIVGLNEDVVSADVSATCSNTTGVAIAQRVGIGIDSTSVDSADCVPTQDGGAANQKIAPYARYRGFPGLGRHTLVWLEISAAVGTTTWFTSSGFPSGITGTVMG